MAGSREILKNLLPAEENNGVTALAISSGNQVTRGNIDNRSIGQHPGSVATCNTVIDGDVVNIPIQSEPVSQATLETILRQTNPTRRQFPNSSVVGESTTAQPTTQSSSYSRSYR